jgi:hypothetical protein
MKNENMHTVAGRLQPTASACWPSPAVEAARVPARLAGGLSDGETSPPRRGHYGEVARQGGMMRSSPQRQVDSEGWGQLWWWHSSDRELLWW